MPRNAGICAAWWLIAVMGAFGSACSESLDPIEVPPGCPEKPIRGPAQWANEPKDRLIDDFEDGDDKLPKIALRDGSWIIGFDQSSDAVFVDFSKDCVARGVRSGRFYGQGFTDWGSNWTAVFRATNPNVTIPSGVAKAVPYDVSAYSAISFWAAAGSDVPLPLATSVGLTTMTTAWNGGVCTSKCMDNYTRTVSLTSSWQRFVVSFDTLKQAGSGDPIGELRKDQVVGFIIWPKPPFDIYLDDVRFEP